jgi:hypothetical protein
MCKRVAYLLVLAFALPLIGAAPALDSTSHPIQINSCAPQLGSGTQSLFGIPVASTSSGIQIQFTNESSKTANLINFAVDSNGETFVMRDVGTFSPGVEITHRYRNGEGQAFVLPSLISPKIKCHVDSVRFADGTVWRRGDNRKSVDTVPATLSVAPSGPVTLAVNGEARLFLVQSSGTVAAFSERDACSGIAKVSLAAAGENSATYSVAPVGRGSCTVNVTEESGPTISVPVNVQ